MSYRKPKGPRIGRSPGTAKLYDLEGEAQRAFGRSAVELGKVLGLATEGAAYYQETVPEAIYSFLEGWDTQAVRAAVLFWLEKNPEEGK